MWLRTIKYIIKIQGMQKRKKICKRTSPVCYRTVFLWVFSKKAPHNSKLSVTDPVVKILFRVSLREPRHRLRRRRWTKAAFIPKVLRAAKCAWAQAARTEALPKAEAFRIGKQSHPPNVSPKRRKVDSVKKEKWRESEELCVNSHSFSRQPTLEHYWRYHVLMYSLQRNLSTVKTHSSKQGNRQTHLFLVTE